MTSLTTSMPKHWDRDPTSASIAESAAAALPRLRAAGPSHGNNGFPRSVAQTHMIPSHAFDRNGAAHSGGGSDRAPLLRVQIFSDLHIGVAPIKSISIAADVDVVVVAGDTCEGVLNAFAHLRRIVPMAIPIVMVIGNHEPYRRCLPDELALARAHAPALNIHLLENDCVIVGGVRFVGATFWTGYDIFGSNNVAGVMNACATGMNDHRLISWQKKPWLRFRPQEAALLHYRSLRYFTETLAVPYAGPTIVVTHTAVLWDAILPKYRSDPITGAFVSDQRALIERFQPSMWIHGHVHNSVNLTIGTCHILCNPHGYGSENPDFDGQLVVEVGV